MSKKEMMRVRADQRAVIADAQVANFPVKLGLVARNLGVEILVTTMQPGVSGQIRLEGDRYVIRINRHEARERQRFTIAHEIAHFLLHKDKIDATEGGISDNVLYRSGQPEAIEFEANRLASEIVMPDQKVEEKLRQHGGRVTDEVIDLLAEEFQVSRAAMEIRLSNFEFA